MNIKLNQEKSLTKVLIMGLGLLFFIVLLICSFFVWNIQQVMHDETERYLAEVSSQVAVTVNDRIDYSLSALESVAVTYVQLQEEQDTVFEFLRSKAELYDYIQLVVVDQSGYVVNMDGQERLLFDTEALQPAIQGNRMVTRLNHSPIDGGEGILYAVPIYDEQNIIGALAGWKTMSQMRDLLSIESFGGEGFSQILDRDGNLVVSADHKNAPGNVDNLFHLLQERGTFNEKTSLEELYQLLQQGGAGPVYYSLDDGVAKLGNFQPLKEGGLYVFSVVPLKAAAARFDTLVHRAVLINVVIVFLFLCLLITIIWIMKRHNEKLSQIAFVDPVTGGYSRARFEIEASERIHAAQPETFLLVSLDIKRFKLINDAFGSKAGDAVLRYIAEVIERQLQPGEIMARIEADLFNLLIHAQSQESVLAYLDTIAEEINQFNKSLTRKYYIMLSVGVYKIDDPSLPLVSMQDRASVARKNISKGHRKPLYKCVFYSDVERQRMLQENALENRMELALENGEFVVYYQPKIDLKSNLIIGAEALVRWQDQELGLIPPNDFIPLFEKNGFIIKLDLYVFEQVCKTIRRWLDSGITPITVSLNLSQAHLNDPNFLDEYTAIWKRYEFPAELLELELTETMIHENMETVIDVIDQIHAIGFQCSLDDFGSGYSTLSVLKDIKVDVLKLDRAFLNTNRESDARVKSIISSIVSMANKLQMKTVAEGVETAAQMEFLRKSNCTMAQGYYISKPVPRQQFEQLAFGKTIAP